MAAAGFNPRTREGATHNGYGVLIDDQVSIHAPVKVRLPKDLPGGWKYLFQSTHP